MLFQLELQLFWSLCAYKFCVSHTVLNPTQLLYPTSERWSPNQGIEHKCENLTLWCISEAIHDDTQFRDNC